MRFASFDTDKLIFEIERHPSLWDTSHSNYANKIIKQESWNDVCRVFKEGFDSMDAKEKKNYLYNLQRKWKSLRNSYAREQSKRKTLKSGLCSKSWKTYVYYNQLSFLSTRVGNKQTTSNFNGNDADQYVDVESASDNEDNDNMNDSGEEHANKETIPQSRPSKKKKTQTKDSEIQLFLSIQKTLEDRNEKLKSMDDPDRLFLLSLINDLKQVPEHKKMEVKLSILQTISNAK